jgi:hypothetical protein
MTKFHLRRLLGMVSLMPMAGCAGNPSLNLLGSYFPGWVLCIFVASLLTVALRFVLRRFQAEHQLAPLIVVYPSLAVLLCLTLWLILFGVR